MPGIASLASALASKITEKAKGAYIIELNADGAPKSSMKLQYFPESISDTKAVNYQTKEVPGASLPLYQWISSGERVISFTAVFTSDIDLGSDSDALGVLKSQTLQGRIKASGVQARNVDIRSAVAMLRRYMLPTYADSTTGLTQSPSKLRLSIPGSGIGASGGFGPGAPSNDAIVCVMTQCEVTYDAFFVSGLPRVASVSLAFAQIAQFGGEVQFPSRSQKMDQYVTKGGNDSLGYPLTDDSGDSLLGGILKLFK